MGLLLMILVADGLISEDNLFLNKEVLRCYLLKNRNRFPHVTQSDLGHNMLARQFVDNKTTGDFELAKKKLKALIQREEAVIKAKVTTDAAVKAQLEQAIELTINFDLLTPSNLVVVRRKMRELLQAYGLITPLEFYDLSFNLKKYSYLEQKPNNQANSLVFQLAKVKHLLDKRSQMPKQDDSSPEMECAVSKHEQLKRLVRLLVEEELLTREQYVLSKDQVRRFLRENETEFSSLNFKNVRNLKK
jgi:hypothetical protein